MKLLLASIPWNDFVWRTKVCKVKRLDVYRLHFQTALNDWVFLHQAASSSALASAAEASDPAQAYVKQRR